MSQSSGRFEAELRWIYRIKNKNCSGQRCIATDKQHRIAKGTDFYTSYPFISQSVVVLSIIVNGEVSAIHYFFASGVVARVADLRR